VHQFVLEEAEHLMIKTREYEGENEQMSFGTTGENGFGTGIQPASQK